MNPNPPPPPPSAGGVLIADLTCAMPRDAWTDADSHVHTPIAPKPPGGWRIVDYRTTHYAGRFLQATDPCSATITIPLRARGWHAVSIGMSERQFGVSAIELRLTGEERWQLLFAVDGPMHEEPWTFADLTGRDLEVRYPRENWTGTTGRLLQGKGAMGFQARIMSVRLTPVDEADAAILRSRGERHRRMVYFNDGHGLFGDSDKPGYAILDQALGPFAGSDWDTCCFCHVGADLVNYPSKVVPPVYAGAWDIGRERDGRLSQRNMAAMIDAGQDAMRYAIESAHRAGQTFWQYTRPQGWTGDPEFGHALRSPFFAEHPEYRCEEADGRFISKLSIAYPAVRERLNSILREGLERGADGVCLVFVRGYPLVRYEAPVRERFAARFGGRDARGLPDVDTNLRSVWGEFVREWIEEVRAMLDAAGASPLRKRRELAIMTGPDHAWNSRFGIDAGSLSHAGLIDAVLPYPYGTETTTAHVETAEYARMLAGSGVQLLPSLGSWGDHQRPIAEFRRRAHLHYRAGATGLCRWDTDQHLARLGLDDPEIQRLWCEKYMGPQQMDVVEIGGMDVTAFGPNLGF